MILWGQDFRYLNPWIAVGVLALLVVVDRLSPALLFPPAVPLQLQPYPWQSSPPSAELEGGVQKVVIEPYDVHFLAPGSWEREDTDLAPGVGKVAIQFRGPLPYQFITLWINDSSLSQASREQLVAYVTTQIRGQHGRLKALGHLALNNGTVAVWADYSLMGIRRERRVFFILDSLEYVVAFSSSPARFDNDVGIFDGVLASFSVKGSNFVRGSEEDERKNN